MQQLPEMMSWRKTLIDQAILLTCCLSDPRQFVSTFAFQIYTMETNNYQCPCLPCGYYIDRARVSNCLDESES